MSDPMAYVLVFVVALLTGASVYWLTLRAAGAEPALLSADGDGFLPPPPMSSTPAATAGLAGDGVYVPVVSDERSWQTRTIGVLGLVIAITLAAALLAFSLYQAGAIVAHMLRTYAS